MRYGKVVMNDDWNSICVGGGRSYESQEQNPIPPESESHSNFIVSFIFKVLKENVPTSESASCFWIPVCPMIQWHSSQKSVWTTCLLMDISPPCQQYQHGGSKNNTGATQDKALQFHMMTDYWKVRSNFYDLFYENEKYVGRMKQFGIRIMSHVVSVWLHVITHPLVIQVELELSTTAAGSALLLLIL